jgi:hypothetical protein
MTDPKEGTKREELVCRNHDVYYDPEGRTCVICELRAALTKREELREALRKELEKRQLQAAMYETTEFGSGVNETVAFVLEWLAERVPSQHNERHRRTIMGDRLPDEECPACLVAAPSQPSAPPSELNEIDIVRKVLDYHQMAFAKAKAEGHTVIESHDIGIGQASVELAALMNQFWRQRAQPVAVPAMLPDEDLMQIVGKFIDVPACDPTKFNEFFHALERYVERAAPASQTDMGMREALEKLRAYNEDVLAGRINYRPEDHISVIETALPRAVKSEPPSVSKEKP